MEAGGWDETPDLILQSMLILIPLVVSAESGPAP